MPAQRRVPADLPDADRAESLKSLLRRFRFRAGLSQEQLAEKAGLSPAAVGALEQGVRQRPHPNTTAALADALQLSPVERMALLEATGLAEQRRTAVVLAPARHTRVPIPPAPLIGRAQEQSEIREWLLPNSANHARLVTLAGPGGVGKTRLALELASGLVEEFRSGVVYVELASLQDHRLVGTSLARALDLDQSSRGSALDKLVEQLRQQCVLLVLDNFEHLMGAVPLVAELLQHCPQLTILITSRTILRLRAERVFMLDPLPTHSDPDSTLDAIGDSAAVQLFLVRAREVVPELELDVDNARAIAAVCHRLDGIPLAIELAAARARLLRPAALLRRLDRSLNLLASRAPDVPERQRTLRNTLAWSRDLLGTGEQVLFRRLAVFAGSWTLESAEAVCADDVMPAVEVLNALENLVDNSLVRHVDDAYDEPRFGMLDTVHEYAQEWLDASGEADLLRGRHQAWCLAMAEQAATELAGPQQGLWLERLDLAIDDLRAAMTEAETRAEPELGLRLAGALERFWPTRRYVGEGRDWLERFLRASRPERIPAAEHARASYAAGLLANLQGDLPQAAVRLEESIELYHHADDQVGVARALGTRGGVAYDQGHLAFASALWQQALAQAREAGDLGEMAHAVGNVGEAYFHLGRLAAAAACHSESLGLARQAGRSDLEAMQLGNLGNIARVEGDLERATTLQRAALKVKWELGARRQIAITLADLASIAGAQHDGLRAARLLGAATSVRELIGTPQPVPERTATERAVADARGALGEATWAAAFAAGRALPLDQAIAYALE